MARVEKISVREFSRRLGCSDTAIKKAIKSGHIDKGYIERNTKRPKILYEVAIKEWRESQDPDKVQSQHLYAALFEGVDEPVKVKKDTKKSKEKSEPKEPKPLPPPRVIDEVSKRLKASNASKNEYAAKMAELKYKAAEGLLVDRDTVYKVLFDIGNQLKKSIMSVPDRVIDEIISCDNRNEAYLILKSELTKSLENISNIKDLDFE